jgi:hypothetical protein
MVSVPRSLGLEIAPLTIRRVALQSSAIAGLKASRLLEIESRGTMNDRLAILTSARERMLEDRDQFAKTLAGPPDRERSERARSKFLELQTLIEAIERAIDGERRRAEPGPTSTPAQTR